MIRTCPRCELRFRSESELSQHMTLDHDAPPLERYHYRSTRQVEPLYGGRTRAEARGPKRYLIVANQTLDDRELVARVQELAAAGPATFHVVVPATHSADYLRSHTLAEREVVDAGGPGERDEVGLAQARFRLRQAVEALRAAGVHVEGEVGVADPFHAVENAVEHVPADEVILSTLPRGLSRWLDADLPSRIERRLGLPVTTLVRQA